jgi:hypothetical protein
MAGTRQGRGDFDAHQGDVQFGFQLPDPLAQGRDFIVIRIGGGTRDPSGAAAFGGNECGLQQFDAQLVEARFLDAQAGAGVADAELASHSCQQHFEPLLGFRRAVEFVHEFRTRRVSATHGYSSPAKRAGKQACFPAPVSYQLTDIRLSLTVISGPLGPGRRIPD